MFKHISDIKEVPPFDKYIKFQEIIMKSTMETLDEDFKKVEEIFTEEDMDELATNCLIYSFFKEMDNDAMIELVYRMIQKWEKFRKALIYSLGCRDFAFPYTRLFKILYYKGVFSFDELQSEAAFINGFSFMFAKEINNPEEYPIQCELMKDNWKIFDEIMEYGFPKDSLGYALSHDDISLLEKLSKEPDFDPNKKINQSYFNTVLKSLLYTACFYNSQKCVKFLLEKGATFTIDCLYAYVSACNVEEFHKHEDMFPDTSYAINYAVWRKLDGLFDELHDKYPNYVVPVYNCTHICAYKYIYFFMENGVDPNDPKYQPALFEAAENGLLSVVKYIIEKGYPINVRSEQKETSLHAAVYFNRFDVVKYLIEKGIDINAYGRDDKEFTAYDVAVRNEFNDIAEYIKEHGGKSISEILNSN